MLNNEKEVKTFKSFDIDTFKSEKKIMIDYRQNACGENLETIFQTITDKYMPDFSGTGVLASYKLNGQNEMVIDRLLSSDNDDERLNLIEPLVAVKVHTALSILTQRTPDVKWDSDNEEYEARVEVLNSMRDSDWDDEDTRQQYIMLWFYFIMFGTTFWRRYFSFEKRKVHLPSSMDLANESIEYEEKEVVDSEGTKGEAMSPLDVLIGPETQAFMPSSLRRVIYTKVYDYDKFSEMFKDMVPKKTFDQIIPGSVEGYEGDRWVKCEYYENKDLDLYYIVAQDEFEVLKDYLPQNHKQLSVMMATWMPRRNPKCAYGLGPIEMMLPDKDQLDTFKSMTLTQLKFSIYKSVFYTGSLEGDGEGGDIRIRPDRAYKTSQPKDITFYDMPGPGSDAWKSLEFLRAGLDETTGINRPLSGEIVKTTAFQTDLAKDAALARLFVPINNIVSLLERDAYLTYELQKQHLSLPEITEVIDPDKMEAMIEELNQAKALGKATFDIFIDQNESGDIEFYRAQFRTKQVKSDKLPTGERTPARGKKEVVLTPELFEWKGKIRVVQDSLFSITPSLERTRKMELYNLLIPLFGQPPQIVAKTAQRIVRLYGEDPNDVLPEDWILYLKGIQSGQIGQPPMPGSMPPPMPVEGANGQMPQEALKFEQQRAPSVVTNIGGQKDLISARSEQISP